MLNSLILVLELLETHARTHTHKYSTMISITLHREEALFRFKLVLFLDKCMIKKKQKQSEERLK